MNSRGKKLLELAKEQILYNEDSGEECDDSDRDKDFFLNQMSDSDSSDDQKYRRIKIQKVRRNLMNPLSHSNSANDPQDSINQTDINHSTNIFTLTEREINNKNEECQLVDVTTEQERIVYGDENNSEKSSDENNKELDEMDVETEVNKNYLYEREQDSNCSVDELNKEAENVQDIGRKKRPRKIEERMLNLKKKHPFRAPNCGCKDMKCTELLIETERKRIYEEFWKMKKQDQRIWLSTHVKEAKAKRKVEGSRRNFSRKYYIDDESLVPVCQKFFLSSIGYNSTTVIDVMLKACKDEHGNRRMLPLEDQRGRHVPSNKISATPIKEHINSFKPKHSHYRRSHAPNRKYLPADLSIKTMYEDYLSNPNNKNVSYEVYRRNLDQMNIGFYEVGADKCGYCIEMDLNPTEENLSLKEQHLEQVKRTREKYRADGELANQNPNIRVFAADLQKVFLLPRMPKVKDSFFISRLIVFNETFASLSNNKQHFCILWHEAMAGRRAEDVTCSFLKILDLNRRRIYILVG